MHRRDWHSYLHIGIAVHFAVYLVVLVVASFLGGSLQTPQPAGAASFNVASFLAQSAPSTAHEANPHGVPVYYDWYSQSKMDTLAQPRPETTHVNFWGEIYADTSNVHPTNTRVALKNCQFWGMFGGVWAQIQNDAVSGGAWSEDYTSYIQGIDIRTDSDGSQSVKPRANENAHFWPNSGFYNVNGQVFQAAFAMCQTRLVLENSAGVDDRDSARYILSMGADWRQPDGSCPFVFGSYICDGMGHGKYIRVTKEWRTAVFSSMSSAETTSLTMPPSAIFAQPDGSYPDMLPEISGFSASPSTITAGSSSLLSWTSSGGASSTIDQGIGAVTTGSVSVQPSATTTYTLTVANSQGSVSRQVTVTVPGTQPVNQPATQNGTTTVVAATPTPSSTDTAPIATEPTPSTASVQGVDLPVVANDISVGSIKVQNTSALVVGSAIMAGTSFVAAALLFWLKRRR